MGDPQLTLKDRLLGTLAYALDFGWELLRAALFWPIDLLVEVGERLRRS